MVSTLEECLAVVGPVPYKELVVEDAAGAISPRDEDEHADIIAALPSDTYRLQQLHQYQGVWMLRQIVRGVISTQRRFTPRPGGDVLLAFPPKCGTTWIMSLAFATMARATYPPSAADHPLLRLNPHECVPRLEGLFSAGREATLEALPSPRLMSTHMHHAMLPPSLANNPHCKIVFVCREPKDMLVSWWHFIKSNMTAGDDFPLSDVLDRACEGKSAYGPFWDHLLGYWRASKATPERVMFLRYEEMQADQVATVRELARFLGVPFTADEEVDGSPARIAQMCSIDNMRSLEGNQTGKFGVFVKFPRGSFFRKGVVGDWVNHMTPEMARRVDAIVEDKLRGSGLTFTS